ncbi:MAG: hypothetical protein HQK52_20850 [Oligoflexia bacterium]|nr:hypothetical protein [Oligoflexia bacterium]
MERIKIFFNVCGMVFLWFFVLLAINFPETYAVDKTALVETWKAQVIAKMKQEGVFFEGTREEWNEQLSSETVIARGGVLYRESQRYPTHFVQAFFDKDRELLQKNRLVTVKSLWERLSMEEKHPWLNEWVQAQAQEACSNDSSISKILRFLEQQELVYHEVQTDPSLKLLKRIPGEALYRVSSNGGQITKIYIDHSGGVEKFRKKHMQPSEFTWQAKLQMIKEHLDSQGQWWEEEGTVPEGWLLEIQGRSIPQYTYDSKRGKIIKYSLNAFKQRVESFIEVESFSFKAEEEARINGR